MNESVVDPHLEAWMQTQRLDGSVYPEEGEEPILEGLTIVLTEWRELGGKGLKRWRGYFDAGDGIHQLFGNDRYRLRLEDGREGLMIISTPDLGNSGGGGRVNFSAGSSLE